MKTSVRVKLGLSVMPVPVPRSIYIIGRFNFFPPNELQLKEGRGRDECITLSC